MSCIIFFHIVIYQVLGRVIYIYIMNQYIKVNKNIKNNRRESFSSFVNKKVKVKEKVKENELYRI